MLAALVYALLIWLKDVRCYVGLQELAWVGRRVTVCTTLWALVDPCTEEAEH